MTTTANPTTCTLDGCKADHDVNPGLHHTSLGEVTDLYGKPVNVELFHDDRGHTGIAVGDLQIPLFTGSHLAGLLRQAMARGAGIPGVVAAEIRAYQ